MPTLKNHFNDCTPVLLRLRLSTAFSRTWNNCTANSEIITILLFLSKANDVRPEVVSRHFGIEFIETGSQDIRFKIDIKWNSLEDIRLNSRLWIKNNLKDPWKRSLQVKLNRLKIKLKICFCRLSSQSWDTDK